MTIGASPCFRPKGLGTFILVSLVFWFVLLVLLLGVSLFPVFDSFLKEFGDVPTDLPLGSGRFGPCLGGCSTRDPAPSQGCAATPEIAGPTDGQNPFRTLKSWLNPLFVGYRGSIIGILRVPIGRPQNVARPSHGFSEGPLAEKSSEIVSNSTKKREDSRTPDLRSKSSEF